MQKGNWNTSGHVGRAHPCSTGIGASPRQPTPPQVPSPNPPITWTFFLHSFPLYIFQNPCHRICEYRILRNGVSRTQAFWGKKLNVYPSFWQKSHLSRTPEGWQLSSHWQGLVLPVAWEVRPQGWRKFSSSLKVAALSQQQPDVSWMLSSTSCKVHLEKQGICKTGLSPTDLIPPSLAAMHVDW